MPESSVQLPEYTLSTRSHVKMLMHCLKYHYATVNGLLLTSPPPSVSSPTTTTSNDQQDVSPAATTTTKSSGTEGVEIVDVVPLFHLGHGLSPMLEVALLQVSSYCKERNLVIGGLYQASRYFHDSSPDAFAYKIAEKLAEHNPQAILLSVNNLGLAKVVQEESDAESSLTLYTFSDGKWKQRTGFLHLENPSKSFSAVNELILSQGLQEELKDFDNHLDDVTNDWRNHHLHDKIEGVSSRVSSSS